MNLDEVTYSESSEWKKNTGFRNKPGGKWHITYDWDELLSQETKQRNPERKGQ